MKDSNKNSKQNLISKFKQATLKLEEAHSVRELDDIFNSFLLVLEGFIRTKAYENAKNVIDFVDNGYPKKNELIVCLRYLFVFIKKTGI
jgi:hypothetical protein